MASFRVQIDTTEFQFSHGRKPRGEGLWVFFSKDDPAEHFMHRGTYTDACAAARSWARSMHFKHLQLGA